MILALSWLACHIGLGNAVLPVEPLMPHALGQCQWRRRRLPQGDYENFDEPLGSELAMPPIVK